MMALMWTFVKQPVFNESSIKMPTNRKMRDPLKMCDTENNDESD